MTIRADPAATKKLLYALMRSCIRRYRSSRVSCSLRIRLASSAC